MLVDENADDGEFRELEHLPRGCGAGGLHIKSRNGDLVKVDIPRDCLAFQVCACVCIHSLIPVLYLSRRLSPLCLDTRPSHPIANTTHVYIQLGEAAQVASRGLLVATPHLVKGIHDPSGGIARNTFAVFMRMRTRV